MEFHQLHPHSTEQQYLILIQLPLTLIIQPLIFQFLQLHINKPTLSTIQCNEDDVMEVLGGIRTRTACGPDGITSVMLKKCAPSISKPLSTIFNSSLATGRLPSSRRYSNVVPIFKSGDPENVAHSCF